MVKSIPLTRGLVTLVDDADFVHLSAYTWCALRGAPRPSYAQTCFPVSEPGRRQRKVYLHRLLLDAKPGQMVDHIDGDPLNNQRANLRIVTPLQNSWNLPRHRDNTSGYKGVSRRKTRWVAQITSHGKVKRLGGFADPRDAARMYDFWADFLFGEYARLNGERAS
jgi:hypothetical protein